MSGLTLTLEVLLACAPMVAPQTTSKIIQVESGGNPLAININGAPLPRVPRDAIDAAALAREYINQGYTVDLGLMQVNSRNLERLGYSVEDMFSPCKNIDAGGRVLAAFYADARPQYADEQSALRAALSAYNTGDFSRGISNGYLARYFTGNLTPAVAAEPLETEAKIADTKVFVRERLPPPDPAPEKGRDESSPEQESAPVSSDQAQKPVVSQNPEDMDIPGVQVEYTLEDAEASGMFEETALSEAEAWDANAGIAAPEITDIPHTTAIMIGGKAIPRQD